MILFVSGTGTGVGKTVVSRALTLALKAVPFRTLAVKPWETGCAPDALDAVTLADACGSPELHAHPAFYRVAPPLAPYAATLAGHPPPDLPAIADACHVLSADCDVLLVEGAGGLMVPLDADTTVADFATRLGSRLVLVAPDRLGVLSDVLSALEIANQRGLPVAAIVLNRGVCPPDPSRLHNAPIVRERASCPVLCFEPADLTDAALVAEVHASGLLAAVRTRA